MPRVPSIALRSGEPILSIFIRATWAKSGRARPSARRAAATSAHVRVALDALSAWGASTSALGLKLKAEALGARSFLSLSSGNPLRSQRRSAWNPLRAGEPPSVCKFAEGGLPPLILDLSMKPENMKKACRTARAKVYLEPKWLR